MIFKNDRWFDHPDWLKALTLQERRDCYRAYGKDFDVAEKDEMKGRWHFKKWREQQPFGDIQALKKRLMMDDMTLAEFKILLSITPQQLTRLNPVLPAWLETLKKAYAVFEYSEDYPKEPMKANPTIGFYYLTQPLTDYFLNRFKVRCEQLFTRFPNIPLDLSKVQELFQEPLFLLLLRTMNKMLILELNVARESGLLKGDDSPSRFKAFVERLRNPDFSLSLLRSYPVLARKLSESADSWLRTRLELVERLCQDWPRILALFSPNKDPGFLVDVEITGDRHQDGRSVAVLTFQSGLKIVYKPRDLGLDQQFVKLIKWLDRMSPLGFGGMRILNCDSHGWVEFVTYESCQTSEGVSLFYRRLGGLLAILYILEASDFHYENLIAHGDMPKLIDLESFFTPYLKTERNSPMSQVGKAMLDSVLQTGLLPWRIFVGKEDKQGIEISGLSQTKGAVAARPAPFWQATGSDKMHLTFKKPPLKGGQNRPKIKGKEVSLLNYSKDLIEGFREIYRILFQNKAQLLDAEGLLAGFKRENRILFRMTMGYSYLLAESNHPDKLRDGLTQDRHWDGLWIGLEKQPLIAQLAGPERNALAKGDIPMFTCRPDSRAIFWHRGSIEGFFKGKSLDRAQEKIQRLSPMDEATQIWFIKGSLATMRADGATKIDYQISMEKESAKPEQFLEAALSVAARLEEKVIEQNGESNWVNLCFRGSSGYHLMPMGLDLYSGLPGQALFYAYLAEVTGREDFRFRAHSILKSLANLRQKIAERWSDKEAFTEFGIGMFSGLAGSAYTLTHAGSLWSDKEMLDAAEAQILWMSKAIPIDQTYDIVGGAAGLIAAALGLYQVNGNPSVLEVAISCGDHLLQRAQITDTRLCWQGQTKRPLTGYAHGASGIAHMLLVLSVVSGESRYKKAAIEALGYERDYYHPERGWSDLRDFTSGQEQHMGETSMCAWCNGATGIGLSRTAMIGLSEDPLLIEEIEASLAHTEKNGFGRSHSLCHGDLGNAELFLMAGLRLGRQALVEKANRVAASVLVSMKTHGWICGVPNHFEALGLMTGITGIGYGFLRLGFPGRVPSLLLLEPPPLKNATQIIHRSFSSTENPPPSISA